jgi:hypothetical protein
MSRLQKRLNRYMRHARTLWSLSAAQWGTLLGVAAMTAIVRGSLSLYSLRDVVKGLRRLAARCPSRRPVSEAYRHEVTWAASRVGARMLPKRPCLTQALVAQFFLWRRGDTSTSLHIGVTKGDDGQLLAHAWLERGGRVIIGGAGSPEQYKRLDQLEERIYAPSSNDA